MTTSLQITPLSLMFTYGLVFLSLFVSYKEKLSFEKDIFIAVFRAFVQLIIAGLVLTQIFHLNHWMITLTSIMIIIINASWNTANRGKQISNNFTISFISISITTIIILAILIISGSLKFIPSQVIPLTGMIAGNSMSAIGIAYRNLIQSYSDNYQKIQEKLALGADTRQASSSIIKKTIKQGLLPVLDQSKTMGLVSIPGMMTGLLLAGIEPIKTIIYQIMIIFVFISTTSISIFISTLLAYQDFFSDRMKLKLK